MERIQWVNAKKVKLTGGPIDFPPELNKNYIKIMQRFIKICRSFGHLSNILFMYLCLCVRILRVVGLLLQLNSKVQARCNTSYFDGNIGYDYC